MQQELQLLEEHSNLRRLPRMVHDGRDVIVNGKRMLNLSSNDYLGLASDRALREEFLRTLTPDTFLPTSSSSRLLTGNFTVYEELEAELARLFGTEAALVFNSGYHANTGILPAVSDAQTLILADKLVHASLIDGIRLSAAKCIRYRHNDLAQLERLLKEHHSAFRQIIIVTESIFSMDGDQADLPALAELKRRYGNVLLYVDEAHAFGVRGRQGLGCAEESGCTGDIDFLVGTFGKAGSIRRRLHRMPEGDTGIPRQPHAHTYLHHRTAPRKHRLDTVCRAPAGRHAGTARASGTHQPDASRSPAGTRIHLPRRQPHRPDDYRAECGYRAESRDLATAWLLRPARAPAYSAGRNVAHPFFADSRYQTRGNRRTEEKNGELEITRKYFKQCP